MLLQIFTAFLVLDEHSYKLKRDFFEQIMKNEGMSVIPSRAIFFSNTVLKIVH